MTPELRLWLVLYALVVLFVVVNTFVNLSFWWAGFAILLAIVLVFLYHGAHGGEAIEGQRQRTRGNIGEKIADTRKEVLQILFSLPFHIFIFAFTFFAVAEEFFRHVPVGVTTWAAETYRDDPFLIASVTMFVAGIVTNIINDLPTSALLADIAATAGVEGIGVGVGEWRNVLVVQSLLVGLGIGAYLTPVGTLAALIWYHLLTRDPQPGIVVPTWIEMVKHGAVHFFVAGVVSVAGLSLLILLWVGLVHVAVLGHMNIHEWADIGWPWHFMAVFIVGFAVWWSRRHLRGIIKLPWIPILVSLASEGRKR